MVTSSDVTKECVLDHGLMHLLSHLFYERQKWLHYIRNNYIPRWLLFARIWKKCAAKFHYCQPKVLFEHVNIYGTANELSKIFELLNKICSFWICNEYFKSVNWLAQSTKLAEDTSTKVQFSIILCVPMSVIVYQITQNKITVQYI